MLIGIQAGNTVSMKTMYRFYSNIGKTICQISMSKPAHSLHLLAESSLLVWLPLAGATTSLRLPVAA
jgi:hypothetical protein